MNHKIAFSLSPEDTFFKHSCTGVIKSLLYKVSRPNNSLVEYKVKCLYKYFMLFCVNNKPSQSRVVLDFYFLLFSLPYIAKVRILLSHARFFNSNKHNDKVT